MKATSVLNNFFKQFVPVLALVLSLSLPGLHGSALAATPDPTEQLKPFLDKIIAQIKTDAFQKDTTWSLLMHL